jgi:hypothetical protein
MTDNFENNSSPIVIKKEQINLDLDQTPSTLDSIGRTKEEKRRMIKELLK